MDIESGAQCACFRKPWFADRIALGVHILMEKIRERRNH